MRFPQRLAARLVVLTVLVLAVVLLLIGGLSLFFAARAYETSVDGDLRATAGEAEARLTERADDPVSVMDELSTSSKFLEIVDPGGLVVARSTNLGAAEMPFDSDKMLKWSNAYHTLEFQEQRVRVILHPLAGTPQPGSYVLVAEAVLDSDRRLFNLAIILLGTASFGLVVGSGGLVVLVRREVKPLRALTDEAIRASSSGFESSIPADGPGSLETKDLRKALSELVEGQRQLIARERSFFADSSHVLRTPMAVLQGAIEQMDSGTSGGEHDHALQQARVALDSMAKSVSALLLLSREGPANPVTWEGLDLDSLLSEIAAQARVTNPALSIDVAVGPDLVVAGDREQLRTLFTSLIENAVQYTPAGGFVKVCATTRGGDAVVQIIDNGIGIPADERERTFERFYRGANARAMRPDGTGLGLAIARRIVELHNGQLSLSSSGRGTVSEVVLPVIG